MKMPRPGKRKGVPVFVQTQSGKKPNGKGVQIPQINRSRDKKSRGGERRNHWQRVVIP